MVNILIFPISDASRVYMYYANGDLSVGEKAFRKSRILAVQGISGVYPGGGGGCRALPGDSAER